MLKQSVADTYPGGPASNLMGITESDLHLSLCARYDTPHYVCPASYAVCVPCVCVSLSPG